MPQIEAFLPKQPLVASIGGSVLFPNGVNKDFVHSLVDFTREQQIRYRPIVGIVGGGLRARHARDEATQLGIIDSFSLDNIGIAMTHLNAELITALFKSRKLNVVHAFPSSNIDPNMIYIYGGTEPGHTTDYVAVKAAQTIGEKAVINISAGAGLHPVHNGSIETEKIIPEITWNDYLTMFSKEHQPGANTLFDKPASSLAKELSMKVVLVGPDFDNIRRMMKGDEFKGTVLHP